MIGRADKIRGGLWGVLVADAMGVPHEFKRADQIPADLAMVLPSTYAKTYREVPYGTWSDDGALTLALADALVKSEHIEGVVERFAEHALLWRHGGAYTPDGVVFDIGSTTALALNRLQRGTPIAEAGGRDETSNGNGSLMRTLPIGLASRKQGGAILLANLARDVSAVTHAHAISTSACVRYCLAARAVARGSDPEFAIRGLEPVPAGAPTGSGFVLDSLAFAHLALASQWGFEETVRRAIALGGDTDTTAAIGGGIVAARDGIEAIPRAWLEALRGREVAEPIIEDFVAKFA